MKFDFENEKVEYKKSTADLKEGIISLSSMLNKNSYGELYFGVKNNGEIIGQQIGDPTLRDISQAIAVNIKPQVIPTISVEFIDDKNVIKVVVSGKEKPYSAYGKYYIRSADEDRELSPTQLKELMNNQNLDSIIDCISPNQNLQFSQLLSLYASKNLTLNIETFKNNLNFYTNNEKYNYLAYLLSDENDVSIKVVTFKGTTKNTMIKRNEYGFKCLIIAMNQVLDYIQALNETTVDMSNSQRKDNSKFNFDCFREAWVNACVHNKWVKQTPPAVYIFDDRIEIISTGGLSPDFTKNEFYKGISNPINFSLQKIFGQLGFIEQTGHGVPLIVEKYGKNAFDIMENFLNVTIPFNTKELKKVKLNDLEQKVIDLIYINNLITISDISKKLNENESKVKRIIEKLKRNNYIKREGSNKNGTWKIIYK